MNIARHLHLTASRAGARTAVVGDGAALTYGELERRSAGLAAGFLAAGLRPGDAVALQSANRLETLEIMYAGFRAGLMVVPIHFKLQGDEVAHILANSGAKLFLRDLPQEDARDGVVAIGGPRYRALLDHEPAGMADVPDDHPAWLFYTSGTTGRAKGATLTHGNLEALVLAFLAEIDPADPDDVFLHAGPMSHASGLCALAHVVRGTRHVLLPQGSFSPEKVIDVIAAQGVTTTFFVPTMISRLMDAAESSRDKLRSLRTIIYGGAPMALPVLERARDVFGPVLVQLYGQGEAPHVLAALSKRDHCPDDLPSWPERLGSAGRPCVGVELKVVDEDDRPLPPGAVGEVVARGHIVMRGYWNDAPATRATLKGGWLHTGDLGYLDARGYLFLTDRKKDLIISGGMNVYAREVEDVLHQHPAVREAAVIGVADADWGEIVKAVVALREDADGVTEADLIAFCRARLAPYKKPKVVEFLAELPKGATGKILKRALKKDTAQTRSFA